MSRIRGVDQRLEVAWLNAAVRGDAAALVERMERQYRAQTETVAQALADTLEDLRFVMLCGPSSAGKTTTTRLLCEALGRRAVNAVMISLDDFYRPSEEIPLQDDGTPDFEAPEAIDVLRLHACARELVQTGHTLLPRYDFGAHAPCEGTVPLTVFGDTVVIFEGVHAFAPSVTAGLEREGIAPIKVYINTMSRFTEDGRALLGRRDLRLTRRLLRDERTRATSFYQTMTMWDDVIRGLTTYILPYAASAEYTVDTTIGYEPSVMAAPMRARLPSLFGTEYEARARQLYEAYGRFEPLPLSAVPSGSLLREFL